MPSSSLSTAGDHAPSWLTFAPGVFVFPWATGFIGSRLAAPYAEPLSFLSRNCSPPCGELTRGA
jgi:hypothetical protein